MWFVTHSLLVTVIAELTAFEVVKLLSHSIIIILRLQLIDHPVVVSMEF